MTATLTRPACDSSRDVPDPAALLADYADREVVLLPGADRTRLVVDRLIDGAGDARLVAHLTADEPDINAVVVTDIYLADPARRARPLTDDDLARSALGQSTDDLTTADPVLSDRHGIRFRIAPIRTGGPRAPELRWLRQPPDGVDGPAECVSSRRVVGALEDYEPVRSLTAVAIARHRRDPTVSVATLGLELRRLDASPIVLNRLLREAVIDASIRRGISLSAIALACGRVKYDQRGRRSGETSWLARRVGLLADDGSRRPTPWVHTDVLGLIARSGLGIAPHEVELG
ncbi:MAG TPA: hypothetical protein VHW26_06265 [Solirubrobacteraceae bacterium]|jgi:hypothetical protein|nr:hypothetical protein [Solirubrobacteraceae bacterium]